MEDTQKRDATAILATENKPKDELPEGGLRAWLVVLGAAFAMFSTFGYINSFGVYQEYYLTHQLKSYSPSTISWIGSIQMFFQFSSGIVAGPLFDKYGEKLIYIPCIVYIFAVMMTSLCTKYYQFVLAQGILGGFSSGIIFTIAVSIPNHYFRRRIGAALGVVVGGSSLGGVLFPITLNKLLISSSIGFGWAVRVCGFMMLACLTIACMTIKARVYQRTRHETPDRTSFKRPVYYLTVMAVFFTFWGIFVPFFYLPSFSVQRGMGIELASYLVSILNAASLFGRVLPGIVADQFGRYNITLLANLCSGVLLLCWEHIASNAAIIVFTILFGFCSGAIVSLVSACIAQITPTPRQIGAHVGLLMFVCSFACLSGPPIGAALVTRYGSYVQAGYFGGTCILFGGVLLFGARLVGERDLRIKF